MPPSFLTPSFVSVFACVCVCVSAPSIDKPFLYDKKDNRKYHHMSVCGRVRVCLCVCACACAPNSCVFVCDSVCNCVCNCVLHLLNALFE